MRLCFFYVEQIPALFVLELDFCVSESVTSVSAFLILPSYFLISSSLPREGLEPKKRSACKLTVFRSVYRAARV